MVLFVSVFVSFSSATTVFAAPLTSLQITGGSFSMGGSTLDPLIPGAFANMSVDGVTYDGSAPIVPPSDPDSYAPTSIVTFNFHFFGPCAVYTAPTDTMGHGPFPAVSGDLTGNLLSLDLSSWIWYWNGNAVNQGFSSVVATTDAAGNFTANWSSVVVGGPFDGQLGVWEITGVASAVPEPASLMLIGSGLAGVVGMRRRKK